MTTRELPRSPLQIALMLGWVTLLAFFFAQIEIQIEGGAGWATSISPWRLSM